MQSLEMALLKGRALVGLAVFLLLNLVQVDGRIPTTLEGPFKPVTVDLDKSFRGNAIDLPDTDHRVQKNVVGFEPEQISVSLSSDYDSAWISWITGNFIDICMFLVLSQSSILKSFNLSVWRSI